MDRSGIVDVTNNLGDRLIIVLDHNGKAAAQLIGPSVQTLNNGQGNSLYAEVDVHDILRRHTLTLKLWFSDYHMVNGNAIWIGKGIKNDILFNQQTRTLWAAMTNPFLLQLFHIRSNISIKA